MNAGVGVDEHPFSGEALGTVAGDGVAVVEVFGSRLTVSESVSANDNRHQACNLGDGPGEQGLNGGKASVEGSASRLCERNRGDDDHQGHKSESWAHPTWS